MRFSFARQHLLGTVGDCSERSPTVNEIVWPSRQFIPSGLTIFNYRWVIHFIFPRQPARQVFTCLFPETSLIE